VSGELVDVVGDVPFQVAVERPAVVVVAYQAVVVKRT
jgi:hypothetical protein